VSAEPRGWLGSAPGGVWLRVHVRPGAARAGLEGFHGAALSVRVRARPVRGAANRELLVLLARALGIRPAALSVEGGARGREKRVRVQGITADAVRARLARTVSVDKAEGRA
jgi:uncharacterized protein (TIGR00251 family)